MSIPKRSTKKAGLPWDRLWSSHTQPSTGYPKGTSSVGLGLRFCNWIKRNIPSLTKLLYMVQEDKPRRCFCQWFRAKHFCIIERQETAPPTGTNTHLTARLFVIIIVYDVPPPSLPPVFAWDRQRPTHVLAPSASEQTPSHTKWIPLLAHPRRPSARTPSKREPNTTTRNKPYRIISAGIPPLMSPVDSHQPAC